MKVLMTVDAVGGVWTYALELARALEPHGVEFVLATMGPPPRPAQRADAASRPNVELLQGDFRLEWMDDPWRDVARAGEWLLQLEAAYRPDIVHLNGFAHGALPFHAPVLIAAHSCVLSWWRAVKGVDAPAEWDGYREAVTRGLGAADLVVAPSAAMLRALRSIYPTLPHARTIHNGRDAARFAPGQKEPLLLTAGRLWDEAKNVAALEAVAPDLTWPLCIAGENPSPPADTAGREASRCTYLGRLTPGALAWWMARASIYALPARYEPFGLSALEAALAGCALVLGDIPSLRELWGDAALFVAPDDRDGLRGAIETLIGCRERRRAMATRARRRALEYTPRRMAEGYLAAYGDVRRMYTARTEAPACAL